MNEAVEDGSERWVWKAEEEQARREAVRQGRSEGWPWPLLPIRTAVSPDDDWLLELELAGSRVAGQAAR